MPFGIEAPDVDAEAIASAVKSRMVPICLDYAKKSVQFRKQAADATPAEPWSVPGLPKGLAHKLHKESTAEETQRALIAAVCGEGVRATVRDATWAAVTKPAVEPKVDAQVTSKVPACLSCCSSLFRKGAIKGAQKAHDSAVDKAINAALDAAEKKAAEGGGDDDDADGAPRAGGREQSVHRGVRKGADVAEAEKEEEEGEATSAATATKKQQQQEADGRKGSAKKYVVEAEAEQHPAATAATADGQWASRPASGGKSAKVAPIAE